ncbi:MAG: 16S rRNA processing protein RimM [Ruminococcaceae bacterium]|nr:16S rRNA processing protein RimM [Oscillospiraceae bacterium]
MKNPYLECGRIVNTHGVKGEVKVEPWCDSPAVFAKLPKVYLKKGNDYICHKLVRASVFKHLVVTGMEGINDVDAAALLKGQTLYAAREDFHLKAGAYFIADLVGLPVIDSESGVEYGKLREVINRGASDIYVVETPSGERMMPAVKEFVKRVDAENGIYVCPIEGMFD